MRHFCPDFCIVYFPLWLRSKIQYECTWQLEIKWQTFCRNYDESLQEGEEKYQQILRNMWAK